MAGEQFVRHSSADDTQEDVENLQVIMDYLGLREVAAARRWAYRAAAEWIQDGNRQTVFDGVPLKRAQRRRARAATKG